VWAAKAAGAGEQIDFAALAKLALSDEPIVL
jgi:hypothetical protein